MTTLTIRRLMSGGVIANDHGVSQCGHCLYNCNPRRSRDYLDADRAAAIFGSVAELGCRSVHIGGGDPLLAPQRLLVVLEAARQAGVHTLLVSMSLFHNAYINLVSKGIFAPIHPRTAHIASQGDGRFRKTLMGAGQ